MRLNILLNGAAPLGATFYGTQYGSKNFWAFMFNDVPSQRMLCIEKTNTENRAYVTVVTEVGNRRNRNPVIRTASGNAFDIFAPDGFLAVYAPDSWSIIQIPPDRLLLRRSVGTASLEPHVAIIRDQGSESDLQYLRYAMRQLSPPPPRMNVRQSAVDNPVLEELDPVLEELEAGSATAATMTMLNAASMASFVGNPQMTAFNLRNNMTRYSLGSFFEINGIRFIVTRGLSPVGRRWIYQLQNESSTIVLPEGVIGNVLGEEKPHPDTGLYSWLVSFGLQGDELTAMLEWFNRSDVRRRNDRLRRRPAGDPNMAAIDPAIVARVLRSTQDPLPGGAAAQAREEPPRIRRRYQSPVTINNAPGDESALLERSALLKPDSKLTDAPKLFDLAVAVALGRPHPAPQNIEYIPEYPSYYPGDIFQKPRISFLVIGGQKIEGAWVYTVLGTDDSLRRYTESDISVRRRVSERLLGIRLYRDQSESDYMRLLRRFRLSTAWKMHFWAMRERFVYQSAELFNRGVMSATHRSNRRVDDKVIEDRERHKWIREHKRRVSVAKAHGDNFYVAKDYERAGGAQRERYLALEGSKQKQLGQEEIDRRAEAWWREGEGSAAAQDPGPPPSDLPYDGNISKASDLGDDAAVEKLLTRDYVDHVKLPYDGDAMQAMQRGDRGAIRLISRWKNARQVSRKPPGANRNICILCRMGFNETDSAVVTHPNGALTGGYAVQLRCGHWFHSNCIKNSQHPKTAPIDLNTTDDSGQPERFIHFVDTLECPLCRRPAVDDSFGDNIYRYNTVLKLRF